MIETNNDNRHEATNAETIIIGLGGFGTQIVNQVALAVHTDNRHADNFLTCCIDIENANNRQWIDICLCLQPCQIVSPAPEWLNVPPMFYNNGYLPIRSVARLQLSRNMNLLNTLLSSAKEKANRCMSAGAQLNICIVTSLFGATGSGIFLQLAMFLRYWLLQYCPGLKLRIQAELLTNDGIIPGCRQNFGNHLTERHRAFVYAALKELNAINRSLAGVGAPVEYEYSPGKRIADQLPFDYCFLHNGDQETVESIADTIFARYFGPTATMFQAEFVRCLRTNARKDWNNMYGFVSIDSYMSVSVAVEHPNSFAIFGSCYPASTRITSWKSPDSAIAKIELLPSDINQDNTMLQVDVLSTVVGIDITALADLREGGKYKIAYDHFANSQEKCYLHLDWKWQREMVDICSALTCDRAQSISVGFADRVIGPSKSVFISYSSKDYETAQQTKEILEKNGIPCWMAPQSIPGGSSYAEEIPEAISKCSALLLLLSQSSQLSVWVPKEVGLAISAGKITIPFHIDDSRMSDVFNFLLQDNQRIEAFNNISRAYQELIVRLKAILS